MGQFLGAGLPVKFAVNKAKDAKKDFDLLKEAVKVEEKLLNYIDLRFYYVSYNNDSIHYKLDVDKVNECLKEFLEEINSIMDLENYLLYNLCEDEDKRKDDDINTVIKKNLTKDIEDIKKKLESIRLNSQIDEDGDEIYYLESTDYEDNYLSERYAFFDGGPWLLDIDSSLTDNVRIAMLTVDLWINFEKIFSEDETILLMLLNKFSKSYFKSKLSKIMLFHITQ